MGWLDRVANAGGLYVRSHRRAQGWNKPPLARRARWPMLLTIIKLDLAMLASRRGDLDVAVDCGGAALEIPRRSALLLPRARPGSAARSQPGGPRPPSYPRGP